MEFIDSHAHLADPAFDADRDEVIARARQAGARAIVSIGESIDAAARSMELAATHAGFVLATAGVHPHQAAEWDPVRDGESIRELVARGAVAIGECGLDYHYDHSPRELQRRAFADQIAIAAEVRRPLIVHNRSSDDDMASMVAEAGAAGLKGVLHCFTGPPSLALAALDAGWHISFAGIITFRKWEDDHLLRLVPTDRLLVESDSPYLAPVPHRGRRNEPAYVALTVERLAAARNVNADELGAATAANARQFFAATGLPLSH